MLLLLFGETIPLDERERERDTDRDIHRQTYADRQTYIESKRGRHKL